jgi:hypothetical protein
MPILGVMGLYPKEVIMLQSAYEIRFQSLFRGDQSLSFPCDPQGHVNLDELNPLEMANYLYARAMIGHEFDMPKVRESLPH